MIRKLTQRDHAAIMGLLHREPELNLFIIGDIENTGYEHEKVGHWGQFDRQGRPVAILTRYFDSLIFYSREPFDLEGFLRLVDTMEWRFFSAESTIIKPFTGRVGNHKRKDTFLARLAGPPLGEAPALTGRVRRAGLEDVVPIVELRQQITEFEIVPDAAMLHQTLSNHEGRAWVIEEQGRMVAVAQTAAESRGLAMIVGVGTHPDFRRRGYATACMAAACGELMREGKTACLFYDNPVAGRIYKRMGFEDIGRWTMLLR